MRSVYCFLISLVLTTSCFAGVNKISEEDGSPSTFPWWLKVTNGTLTNNGDGSVSLNISAVGGGITRTVVITSGSVTAGSTASTDYVYLVAGAHTVTMPTAVGNTNLYMIKNNHSANITIDTTASQTIDGTTSISIAPEESVDLISDGTNWRIQ